MLTGGPVATVAFAALGGVLIPFAAPAEAEGRATVPVSGCLWAGTAYAPGTGIVAGGDEYRCGTRDSDPYWFRGAATDRPATVSNPGAATAPAGRFSAGARQPGTSYTDYCVGAQLVPGAYGVYQVVRHANGSLQWMPAAVSTWSFDGQAQPGPTWRSASLCIDGNLT